MSATAQAIRKPSYPEVPPGEDELPYSDGEPMESERHAKQQALLTSSLARAWADRTDFYVGGNMFVYYSHLQTKKNDFRGPDVFVVLDTIRRERKSWVVWEENGRTPDVVIELLSESTEEVDRGEKMRIYAKLLRVANYYLFDPMTGALEGHALDVHARAYEAMAPLPSGDLPCPALGLSLGVRRGQYSGLEADWLRWLDATGAPLPTDEEAAREAEEQAQIASEQAQIASEQARLASEQARAAEERASSEARLRAEAESKLREALAELEKLKAR